MASGEDGEIIQYVPFASFVHPSFWHTLTEMKLEVDKLDETTKQIYGKFSYRDDVGTVFEVDGTSFNKSPNNIKFYENITGTLMNKNTIEDFKTIDKAALLNSVGDTIWAKVKRKNWVTNPSLLLNFVMLSYADLKKFHYYYWFAFPCPSQPTVCLKESKHITTVFHYNQINTITHGWRELKRPQKPFFAFTKHDDDLTIMTLEECFETGYIDPPSTYFVFEDPSTDKYPGWPLRLFLAALLEHFPSIVNSELNVLGLRCNMHGIVNSSQIFTIKVPANVQTTETAGWVGWERNDKGNFGPKLANMSASMDPVKLADTSSDLNIKLMKWRLVPDINVDVMKKTKCLLLGAGTLGCHVARDLLAWGFRHITFIDSGKVSYSNPTRQVLFNYQDCLAGGKLKAEAAAENLKLILPTVDAKGLVAHIPMPGHPVGDSLKSETLANIKTITQAIEEHDVVFLLLDTREARWLPALLAACNGKIVINAALGFDSYLVMRHGLGTSPQDTPLEGSSIQSTVPGGQLGCYFCNDVTAPGNSLKDRTLDQQCTVTRPGVAAIAGALAVEILVGLLQHPLKAEAPAICKLTDDNIPENTQGVLGPIPHTIRGFLHSYQTVLPTCTKFKQCIACSDTVIQKYKEEGVEFLLKVFNSGTYLEEVTGLAELQLSAEMTDIVTLSDEDEDTL